MDVDPRASSAIARGLDGTDPEEERATAVTAKHTAQKIQPSRRTSTVFVGVGVPMMTTSIGDAEDAAELARAGDHGRGRGEAPARDGGECRAAEDRQGRADADAAEHLAGQPLGEEGGLGADDRGVPEVGRAQTSAPGTTRPGSRASGRRRRAPRRRRRRPGRPGTSARPAERIEYPQTYWSQRMFVSR